MVFFTYDSAWIVYYKFRSMRIPYLSSENRKLCSSVFICFGDFDISFDRLRTQNRPSQLRRVRLRYVSRNISEYQWRIWGVSDRRIASHSEIPVFLINIIRSGTGRFICIITYLYDNDSSREFLSFYVSYYYGLQITAVSLIWSLIKYVYFT